MVIPPKRIIGPINQAEFKLGIRLIKLIILGLYLRLGLPPSRFVPIYAEVSKTACTDSYDENPDNATLVLLK